MKIAVFSDVHGNIVALENAFEDMKKRGVNNVVCLGDLVGYGPNPNEVIDLIREKNITNIRGNYDTAVAFNKLDLIKENEINKFALPWNVNEITEENKIYLRSLPEKISMDFGGKAIAFVHGSTRHINEYLKENSYEAEEIMKELRGDILVCAHTHMPYIKIYGDKLLINDGSIGKPKNGRPNSTYALIEISYKTTWYIDAQIVEIPYDYEKTIKTMEEKNFPKDLIHFLAEGRE